MQDFDRIWHSVLTLVGVRLGGPDVKLFYGSHNAGVCIALLLLYVFAMSLVLLNCLIGIMADACSRVSPHLRMLSFSTRPSPSLEGWACIASVCILICI